MFTTILLMIIAILLGLIVSLIFQIRDQGKKRNEILATTLNLQDYHYRRDQIMNDWKVREAAIQKERQSAITEHEKYLLLCDEKGEDASEGRQKFFEELMTQIEADYLEQRTLYVDRLKELNESFGSLRYRGSLLD